jgi:hypothetical protein
VLLVGLLDALDDASGLNRMSLAMRTY